jgi:enoyl-CoA hydratase/carnithine racemase
MSESTRPELVEGRPELVEGRASTGSAHVPAPADVGLISVEVDTVATICLDRPAKHNAVTPEMLEQLEQILIALDADRNVRVVLVTAAGNRSFCAGADIKRFKVLEPLDMWARWTRLGHRVFDHLAGLRQPTIAAVSGNAYGGGFELALACDLRILADDATLALTEVGIGTLPGWGGTGRLRDLVGAGRAKQLIFTGEPLTAERALAWGVVNQLAPKPDVINTAHAWAIRIAERAPIAVQMAKQAVDAGDAFPSMEQVSSAATAFTEDAAEGFASFTEKRNPHYRGT